MGPAVLRLWLQVVVGRWLGQAGEVTGVSMSQKARAAGLTGRGATAWAPMIQFQVPLLMVMWRSSIQQG